MQQRNPAAVFLLSLITFGIYGLVWEVKTKNELNALGAEIPTAWLLIVPFVSLYWLWKYSEGVEKATAGKTSTVLAFVMLFLLGIIGMAILQNEYNKLGAQPAVADPVQANPGSMPAQPIAATPVGPSQSVSPGLPSEAPYNQPVVGGADNGPSDPSQPAGTPPPSLPSSPIQ
jgi:hypothetical protein